LDTGIFICFVASVADPGCLSRIKGWQDSGSPIWIRIKEFKDFLPEKTYAKFLKIMSGMFIMDAGSWVDFFLSRIRIHNIIKANDYILIGI
jgi:hypothetical protein